MAIVSTATRRQANLDMDQLRRRFSKAYPVSESSGNDGRCQIPTELLILIASYIADKRDIAVLCRISRHFKDIYTPELYRAISVDTCLSKAAITVHFSLYNTLRNLQYPYLVTDLRLCLRSTIVCRKWSYKGSKILRALRPCTCAKYEKSVGDAILNLHSLQSLSMKCTLCEGQHTHKYLFEMNAPSLRVFAFRCFRSHPGSKTQMLGIPFMPQVTSLNLECYQNRSHQSPDNARMLSLEDPIFTPLLHTLCHDETEFANRLLSARPVEKLCLDSYTRRIRATKMSSLHNNIVQSPGELSHFFLIDLLQWLPTAMEQNPEPYLHLRFVGTVIGAEFEDRKAFNEMEPLESLRNLEAIEINRYRLTSEPDQFVVNPDKHFKPSRYFFRLLQRRHPLLRRVLLMFRKTESRGHSGDGILWDYSVVWSSRKVLYLDYWDILCSGMGGARLAATAL